MEKSSMCTVGVKIANPEEARKIKLFLESALRDAAKGGDLEMCYVVKRLKKGFRDVVYIERTDECDNIALPIVEIVTTDKEMLESAFYYLVSHDFRINVQGNVLKAYKDTL